MKSFLHALLSLDVFLMGVLLILLPWLGYWDHNFFLDKYPDLIPILLHPSMYAAPSPVSARSMYCLPGACCGEAPTLFPAGRKPVLCYVTDRHAMEGALAALSDQSTQPNDQALLLEAIRNAAAADVELIQIREKRSGSERTNVAGSGTSRGRSRSRHRDENIDQRPAGRGARRRCGRHSPGRKIVAGGDGCGMATGIGQSFSHSESGIVIHTRGSGTQRRA